MAAETQPFKAAYPASRPEPEVDSQIVRAHMRTDEHTYTCIQPQTQQHVHKYAECCMIAQGEEAPPSPLL